MTQFVVTMHEFYGSSGEAASPVHAWVFDTRAEAESFADTWYEECEKLNPNYDEGETLLNITETEDTAGKSALDLFNDWRQKDNPDWLPQKAKTARKQVKKELDTQQRQEALKVAFRNSCPGCQGMVSPGRHNHPPAINLLPKAQGGRGDLSLEYWEKELGI